MTQKHHKCEMLPDRRCIISAIERIETKINLVLYRMLCLGADSFGYSIC